MTRRARRPDERQHEMFDERATGPAWAEVPPEVQEELTRLVLQLLAAAGGAIKEGLRDE